MTDWRADGPLDDLNEFGEDTESDEEDLEQDVVHRIAEPYGSNPDDRDRGVGVDTFLSGTPNLVGLDRAVALDLRKDDRVDTVSTVVLLSDDEQNGSTYDIDVTINESQTVSTTVGGGS